MLCKNAIKRGGKELKIEDIKIGDLVWVYNDDISNAEYGLVIIDTIPSNSFV